MPSHDVVNWITWVDYAIKTANTAYDGTGVANWVVRPLPKTTFVQKITLQAGDADNVQTVARLFINNGGKHSDAPNNTFIADQTLAVTTQSDDSAVAIYTFTLNLWLPAGYRINVLLGTTVVGGYYAAAFLGQYSESAADPELYVE